MTWTWSRSGFDDNKNLVKVKMEEDSCFQTKHPSLKPQTSTIIVFYNKLHENIAFLLFLKETSDSCRVNKVHSRLYKICFIEKNNFTVLL